MMSPRRSSRRRVWLKFGIPLLVLVLVLGAGWVVGFSPALRVEHVRVTGTDDLKHKTVVRAARVPMDRPLARIDRHAAEYRVADLDAVRSAHVTRSWPHTVTISVTERKPLYRISDGGSERVVDHAGVAFTDPGDKASKLPVAHVDPSKSRLLDEIGTALNAMPESLRSHVHDIEASSRDAIRLKMSKKRTVVWGNADESKIKAKVTTNLLKQKASVYDVSAPGYPTTH